LSSSSETLIATTKRTKIYALSALRCLLSAHQ